MTCSSTIEPDASRDRSRPSSYDRLFVVSSKRGEIEVPARFSISTGNTHRYGNCTLDSKYVNSFFFGKEML